MRIAALAMVASLVLLGACSKPSEPAPSTTSAEPAPAPTRSAVSTATPPASGATATAAGPGDLGWDAPAAWVSVPTTSSMRKATYKIPKVDGDADDAELTVTAAGGGVQPNIERWSGQFNHAEAKTEKRKVNGMDVTVVEMKGPYTGMGNAAGPKAGYMLLGAIVDGGDRQHFFKLIGPEKTVASARKDFDAFVSSLRAK